jgi:gas vesicle protein
LGSIIGALTALLIWPDRSEMRAGRHLRAALRAIARRLGAAVAPATGSAGDGTDARAAHAFHSSIADARTAADNVRLRKTERLHEELELVERLYNSVVMVGRAAETSRPLLQGEPALQETVDTLKSDTSGLVNRLADDKDIALEQVASLRERLTEARGRILDGDPSAASANRRQALIFAFQEILEFLEAIVRLRAARRD